MASLLLPTVALFSLHQAQANPIGALYPWSPPPYPVFTVDSPQNGTAYAGSTVPLVFNVSAAYPWTGYYLLDSNKSHEYLPNCQPIQVWLDGAKQGELSWNLTTAFSLNLTGLAAGQHTLQLNGSATGEYMKSIDQVATIINYVANGTSQPINFTTKAASPTGTPATATDAPKPTPPSHGTDNYWQEIASLPSKFTATLGAAAVDGKIYFIGNTVNEQYDPARDAWTLKAPPLSFPYSVAGVTACQGKIYVIGGTLGMVYDPATDTWQNMTALPTQRYFDAVTVVGKIYCISGQVLAGFGIIAASNESQVYDPSTNLWTEIAPIPTPVVSYAVAALDEKIYVIGGSKSGFYLDPLEQTLVQIYDPASNKWTQGAPLLEPVSGGAAAVTSGEYAPKRIFLVGGDIINAGHEVHYCNHVQTYDPATGNWTFAPQMPTGRSYLALVNVGDELYALGGRNKTVNVSVPGNPTQQQLLDAADQIASTQAHVNEKYVPIGYATVPSPNPSPSPIPTATAEPSSPTPTAESPSPSQTPAPSMPEFPAWTILSLTAASAAVVAAWKLRKKAAR